MVRGSRFLEALLPIKIKTRYIYYKARKAKSEGAAIARPCFRKYTCSSIRPANRALSALCLIFIFWPALLVSSPMGAPSFKASQQKAAAAA